jgi:hypothetical protein
MAHHPSSLPYYPFVQHIESSFRYESGRIWLEENNHLPIIAIIVYLIIIFSGQKWMRSRKPYNLRSALFLWNILLAVFSIIGAGRSLSEFIHVQMNDGLHASICRDEQKDGVHAFWSFAFVVSKLFELGDTVFIVLRKTDLIFLHWWHHITVIIFGWFSGYQPLSIGRWIMSMNFTVHAFMYSYYAARSAGIRFNKFIPVSITSMQILQMITGLVIILYASYVKWIAHGTCQTSDTSLVIGLICYASYFGLFCRFFARSYLQREMREANAGKKKVEFVDSNSNIKQTTVIPGSDKKKEA